MASVGRRALTLQSRDITGLAEKFRLIKLNCKIPEVPDDVLMLFADRVEIRKCGCWHFSGERREVGYARFFPGKKWASSENSLAHRFSSAIFTGEIPPRGMVIDHLCPDRSCVAPNHLQLITFEENVQLGHTRMQMGNICSKRHCPSFMLPGWKSRGSVTGEIVDLIKLANKLKGMLVKPLDDESKLIAFAHHLKLDGRKPKVSDVEVEGRCWEWQGAINEGYPMLTWKQVKGKTRKAHRWACEYFKEEIPRGYQVDHQCNNTTCVNPAHLKPMTGKDNSSRSTTSPVYLNSQKTHCIRGHLLSGENLVIKKKTRQCRTCEKIRADAAAERKKAGAVNKRKENHCPNGHEYIEGDYYFDPKGFRRCRACVNLAAKRRRAKKRTEGKHIPHPRRLTSQAGLDMDEVVEQDLD